jgi:hypothetical protein
MHRESALMIAVMLVLGGCSQLFAGPRSPARPALSTRSAAPAPAPGTTTGEQVILHSGKLPPHPEVTPEESERLLQRTEREDPQGVDNNPPSPPGLPLIPGPETQVAPNPHDSGAPAR